MNTKKEIKEEKVQYTQYTQYYDNQGYHLGEFDGENEARVNPENGSCYNFNVVTGEWKHIAGFKERTGRL